MTTTPAEGALEPFNDSWPADTLDRVGEQFMDAANLLECQRMLEEHSRRGTIVW